MTIRSLQSTSNSDVKKPESTLQPTNNLAIKKPESCLQSTSNLGAYECKLSDFFFLPNLHLSKLLIRILMLVDKFHFLPNLEEVKKAVMKHKGMIYAFHNLAIMIESI